MVSFASGVFVFVMPPILWLRLVPQSIKTIRHVTTMTSEAGFSLTSKDFHLFLSILLLTGFSQRRCQLVELLIHLQKRFGHRCFQVLAILFGQKLRQNEAVVYSLTLLRDRGVVALDDGTIGNPHRRFDFDPLFDQ